MEPAKNVQESPPEDLMDITEPAEESASEDMLMADDCDNIEAEVTRPINISDKALKSFEVCKI